MYEFVLKYYIINYTHCQSELPVSQENPACRYHQQHEGRSPSIRHLADRHQLQRPCASRRRFGACAHPPLRITSDIPSPGTRRSTKTNWRLYILCLLMASLDVVNILNNFAAEIMLLMYKIRFFIQLEYKHGNI